MIKVGFDISQIAYGGGVGNYTDQLAHQLAKQEDLKMSYFFSSLRKKYLGDLPNVKNYHIPTTILEVLFNKFRFPPIEWFMGDVDIYHSSDWTQASSRAKKITTIHDLIPLKFPEWSNPKIVEVHKRRLKIIEKEIDFVIAVSESTKKDLLELSKIPEDKIVVIYEGVSSDFKPQKQENVENFKNKWGLSKEYILAVGGIGERKNLHNIKKAAEGYDLVILGETVKDISREELPLLYCGASVLVYTTLYEGFGLPQRLQTLR